MLPLILEKYKQAEMNLNVKDINGHTPLFVAAIKGYYKLFDILIEAGSDINVQDIEGETILNWAILMHESRFATEILNNHPQLDVNIKNNQGTSALIIASNNGFTSLVQLILDKGANIRESININALNIKEIMEILDSNSLHKIHDEKGFLPIHYAVIRDDTSFLNSLLSKGVNIFHKDFYFNGLSLLSLAVLNGAFNIVKFLFSSNNEK